MWKKNVKSICEIIKSLDNPEEFQEVYFAFLASFYYNTFYLSLKFPFILNFDLFETIIFCYKFVKLFSKHFFLILERI